MRIRPQIRHLDQTSLQIMYVHPGKLQEASNRNPMTEVIPQSPFMSRFFSKKKRHLIKLSLILSLSSIVYLWFRRKLKKNTTMTFFLRLYVCMEVKILSNSMKNSVVIIAKIDLLKLWLSFSRHATERINWFGVSIVLPHHRHLKPCSGIQPKHIFHGLDLNPVDNDQAYYSIHFISHITLPHFISKWVTCYSCQSSSKYLKSWAHEIQGPLKFSITHIFAITTTQKKIQ